MTTWIFLATAGGLLGGLLGGFFVGFLLGREDGINFAIKCFAKATLRGRRGSVPKILRLTFSRNDEIKQVKVPIVWTDDEEVEDD